jgi:putative phosphoribosyl transferase
MFNDRQDAGRQLAQKLAKYEDTDAVVLAVPRGGVSIGYAIAKELGLPMDIVLSKKIGHPLNPEFAIGSVSPETEIIDKYPQVSDEYVQNEIHRIRKTLEEKRALYDGKHPPLSLEGKTAIVVDDGIATGNTLLATIQLLKKRKAAKIVVATPVIPLDRVHIFEKAADEFVYLRADSEFPGVGAFYRDFKQVTDEEVVLMLELSRADQKDKSVS